MNLLSRSLFFFFFVWSAFFIKACAAHEQRILLYLPDEAAVTKKIEESFTQLITLDECTFESDVPLSSAEFNYLVDMPHGSTVDAKKMHAAVAYLSRKNKFESIELVVSSGAHGKKLHWILTGLWVFDRLNITGMLLGKDTYRSLYMLEKGDAFELEKHQLSLAKIKDSFAQEGYLNGQVNDAIVKDAEHKTITANLDLNHGERFVIDCVEIKWLEADHIPRKLFATIEHTIKKQFINKLSNKYYQQKLVNKETKGLRKLLGHQGFLDVGIELEKEVHYLKRKVNLVFKINVHKKKQVVFLGNCFFPQAQLIDAIVAFGASAALLPASILSEEILQLYRTKGFWAAKVQASENEDACIFTIDEGARLLIDDVVVEGSPFAELVDVREQFFKIVLKKQVYDEQLVKEGINKLIDYYRHAGFLEAKVLRQEYVPQQQAPHTILELTIDEGKRTYLTSIAIEEFPELIKQGPFAQFNVEHLRVPFDPSILSEQKKFLQKNIFKQGYTTATIKHELTRQGEDASLTWKVDYDGPHKVTFGKTVVVGSCRLPFEYILRELQYTHGQAWDKEKLKQSLFRLRSLDLFDHIHLYPHQPAVLEPEKTVILQLKEDDPFEVRLRTGLGLQQVSQHFVFGRGVTFAAGLGIIGKCPFNKADQIRFDADFTRSYRKVNAGYLVPWTLGSPVRTLFKAYTNKYYQPTFLESTRNLYEVTQDGFLVSFARKYDVYDTAVSFGIEWMKTDLKNADPHLCSLANQLAQAISFTPQLVDKRVPYFQFEPTLFIDHLDDRLNPTYGSLTLFSFKGMVPLDPAFSDAYFFKLLIEQSLFFPFGYDVVGALRLRVGHIFSAHFDNVMPLERFYLGGSHSIRSYDVDLCPPVGLFIDGKDRLQVVPQGGQTMVNANFECRFPVYKGLGGVLFQDIGTLVGSPLQKSFDEQSLLAGTGFGLRYNTPIGPIRFDIAFKWKRRDSSESLYAWFLSLGQAF